MSHPEQQQFFLRTKRAFPRFFADVRVLDVGSLDINGNIRHLFDSPVWYTGIDLAPGKNVDVVAPGHLFDAGIRFDVVISAESLEHDLYYARTLLNMVRLLRPGGLLAFSCASTGREEHGTRRSSPENAPFLESMAPEWADHYHNLTEGEIRVVLPVEEYFDPFHFEENSEVHDLYFWGIKQLPA